MAAAVAKFENKLISSDKSCIQTFTASILYYSTYQNFAERYLRAQKVFYIRYVSANDCINLFFWVPLLEFRFFVVIRKR